MTTPTGSKLPSIVGCRLTDLFDPEEGVVDARATPYDIALHDLAGRVLGLPAHAMMGGSGSCRVSCYSGAIYMEDLDPPADPRGVDGVLAACRQDHELGFREFKLKIGRGARWMSRRSGLDSDLAIVDSVRQEFPDAGLLVDANDSYTVEEAIAFMETAYGLGVRWLEEPFPESASELEALKNGVPDDVLVVDGERRPDLDYLLSLAKGRLIDVMAMDVRWFGYTAWRKTMRLLVSQDMVASPHTWGTPLNSVYAAHLARGYGNIAKIEGVPGRVVEMDGWSLEVVDGAFRIPPGDGFGLPFPNTATGPRPEDSSLREA